MTDAVWQWEMIRLSFFSPEFGGELGDTFERVVGNAPEVATRTFPTSTAEGAFGGGRIALNASFGRVDWLLIGAQDGPQLPLLASLDDSVSVLRSTLSTWTESLPMITRVAFGAVARKPTESKIDSYEKLQLLLPSLRIDPHNSEDFGYTINRPRQSKSVPGLKINRLTKWNGAQFFIMMDGKQHELGHFVRLDLDCNTDTKNTNPLNPMVNSLLTELYELGKEITVVGDVP